jgi:NADH:ubiquinone oxidoreductase subunit B-like Fe-S oxidoreductase
VKCFEHRAERIPVDIYAGDPRERSEALAEGLQEFCSNLTKEDEIISVIYTADGSAIVVVKRPYIEWEDVK